MENDRAMSWLAPYDVFWDELTSLSQDANGSAPGFFVGSVAEGLGTPRSDIDLLICSSTDFFLSPAAPALGTSRMKFARAFRIGERAFATFINGPGFRIQVEIVPLELIFEVQDAIRATLEAIETGGGNSPKDPKRKTAASIQYSDKILLHRLYRGIPLRADVDYSHVYERLSYEQFRTFRAINHASDSAASIEDYFGIREQGGDYYTEFYLLHKILLDFGRLILLTHQETNPAEKQLFRLLAKIDDALTVEYLAVYRNLGVLSQTHPGRVLTLLDEILDAAEGCFPQMKNSLGRGANARLKIDRLADFAV